MWPPPNEKVAWKKLSETYPQVNVLQSYNKLLKEGPGYDFRESAAWLFIYKTMQWSPWCPFHGQTQKVWSKECFVAANDERMHQRTMVGYFSSNINVKRFDLQRGSIINSPRHEKYRIFHRHGKDFMQEMDSRCYLVVIDSQKTRVGWVLWQLAVR